MQVCLKISRQAYAAPIAAVLELLAPFLKAWDDHVVTGGHMVDLDESLPQLRPALTSAHSTTLLMATSLQSLCVCLDGSAAAANNMIAAIATLRSLRRLHLVVPADANLGALAQLSSLEDFALQTIMEPQLLYTPMASCGHVLRSSRDTLQAVQLNCFGYTDDVYLALQCLPQLQTIMLKVYGLTRSAAACIGNLAAAQSIHVWLVGELFDEPAVMAQLGQSITT